MANSSPSYYGSDGQTLDKQPSGYFSLGDGGGWTPYSGTVSYWDSNAGKIIPLPGSSPSSSTSPTSPGTPTPGSLQDIQNRIANWKYPQLSNSGSSSSGGNTYGRTPLMPFVPQAQSNARPSAASLLASMPQRSPISNLWANQQSGSTALQPVAKLAMGGPVPGVGGGQADNVLTSSRPQSFIIPADVVADLGDGSSKEGHRRLQKTWSQMGYACGGSVGRYAGGGGVMPNAPVPVALSPDEHEVPPEVVTAIGRGSNKAGSAKLHQMINHVRAHKARKGHPPLAKSPLAYMGVKNAPKPVNPPMQMMPPQGMPPSGPPQSPLMPPQ